MILDQSKEIAQILKEARENFYRFDFQRAR